MQNKLFNVNDCKYFQGEYSKVIRDFGTDGLGFLLILIEILEKHPEKPIILVDKTFQEMKNSTNTKRNITEMIGSFIDYGFFVIADWDSGLPTLKLNKKTGLELHSFIGKEE